MGLVWVTEAQIRISHTTIRYRYSKIIPTADFIKCSTGTVRREENYLFLLPVNSRHWRYRGTNPNHIALVGSTEQVYKDPDLLHWWKSDNRYYGASTFEMNVVPSTGTWRGFSPVSRWMISKECFTILTVISFLPEHNRIKWKSTCMYWTQ